MKFLEMMRKTTFAQRVMVTVSIVWILILISMSHNVKWGRFDGGGFALGLIPIVAVWGGYWIFFEIIEKRKNK